MVWLPLATELTVWTEGTLEFSVIEEVDAELPPTPLPPPMATAPAEELDLEMPTPVAVAVDWAWPILGNSVAANRIEVSINRFMWIFP
jgi:hypothetical protein